MPTNFEIESFINSNVKDYDKGVELMYKYGSRREADYFKKANPAFHASKLYKRLALMVNRAVRPSAPALKVKTASPALLPEPIIRTKEKLHELYLALVLFHDRLLAEGDSNSPEAKARRQAILEERKPFIDAYSQLYELKEDFFALPEGGREVPQELVDLLAKLDHNKSEKPAPNANVEDLTDEELKKQSEAIRKKISRRQNQIDYQSDKRQPQRNPLPNSPLRSQLESELAELQPLFKLFKDEINRRKSDK